MRNYSFQLDDDDSFYLESLRSTFSRDERRRVSTRDLVIAALQAFESTLSDILEAAAPDDDDDGKKPLPRKPRRKRDADGKLIDDDDEQDNWDGTPSTIDPFTAALEEDPLPKRKTKKRA
jgi:hypothetical protein